MATTQFFFFYSGDTEGQLPSYQNAAAKCNPPLTVTAVSIDSGSDALKYWGKACTIECVVVLDGNKVKGSCAIFPDQVCSFFTSN